MPVDATFMPSQRYLSAGEYKRVIAELSELGLEEIRFTGGEPLLRQDFVHIAESVAELAIKKLGLTSNGIVLDRHLETLERCRIHHLNISLDSLERENFKRITYGDYCERVVANILKAKDRGFDVKLNVVAMKGINDFELFDFVAFAACHQIEVRFLELMRIGHACNEQNAQFISAKELIARLEARHVLTPVNKAIDSTSFNFRLDNGANIGFIASETQPFCSHCSRWRLSADGMLRACLLRSEGLSIKNTSEEQRQLIYRELLGMKPFLRPQEVSHRMNEIGG